MSSGSTGRTDWDASYREGTPLWETNGPSPELVRLVEEGLIARGTALEIGCGTGADAVYLVKKGFEVTAVDNSPTAIERARVRADREDALPRLLLADIFEFAPTAGQFDFVYDRGFYHHIRLFELDRYLDTLWRVTRPGSGYLTLAGAPREAGEEGPPQVTSRQLYNELGRLFEMVRLEQCRLTSAARGIDYPGWSCLMQRPVLGK